MNDRNRMERVLKETVLCRERHTFVNKLALALQMRVRIPSGMAWVLALGDGSERSNLDALRSWLTAELKELDTLEQAELMEVLARRLRDRLEAFVEQV